MEEEGGSSIINAFRSAIIIAAANTHSGFGSALVNEGSAEEETTEKYMIKILKKKENQPIRNYGRHGRAASFGVALPTRNVLGPSPSDSPKHREHFFVPKIQ